MSQFELLAKFYSELKIFKKQLYYDGFLGVNTRKGRCFKAAGTLPI